MKVIPDLSCNTSISSQVLNYNGFGLEICFWLKVSVKLQTPGTHCSYKIHQARKLNKLGRFRVSELAALKQE